ncbi:ATPase, histidine kinase-, DNA gyrase B (macronuclear) [Tetrahymena thermophila SB210]|uniref:ATPase, histidine kinase-, DNA gyrase B n=1 Tax=Tetrahymena thermophila (strain SB210) TaxID=312017 RepID=I7M7F2_TETTS|nr:ATPase, histidine kinase-, DNA gyrase B [Tetrahymena thermophila SB210]EAR92891.2 ATPase, histidine kinase-, DNA gyrase B [Tetrahymena thermophila SB210]|eukprot:XP_001013136.2 ATPase, histidine kinase-, DNA gyrase B [Tetrahymena thermophila SB210]
MMTGIIMLINQYVQSHTILKILNNLIVIIVLLIINSAALYIRISLLSIIISISITVHFKDKQNKLKFFDYFKKHQELKGWQKFLSEELPQSVFLVTKNQEKQILNDKKLNIQNESSETKNLQNNKNSVSDNENAHSKIQDHIQTNKKNEIQFSQIAKVNSIYNKNQTERSQTLYNFAFMNNRCSQFIFGNKDQQSDTKADLINGINNSSKQTEQHQQQIINSDEVAQNLKQQLQKLIILRKKEQVSSIQQESLHSYILKCDNQSSSLRKFSKKKSQHILSIEKERISLDQLINEYFEGQSTNYYSYDKQRVSSKYNLKSQRSQNNDQNEINSEDSQLLCKFKPVLIEHQVNCQHFLPNKYFDLKIYECNYNDKQSLMIIMDDISEKVMEERLRDVENYKEKLLSMITHNLKTPLNGIICILESIVLQQQNAHIDQQNLNAVLQSSKLLSYMINDLIDYSCIIKGNLSLNPKFFSIQESINALTQLFQDQMQYKNIKLIVNMEKSIQDIIIFNDQQRFMQILVNLISNSLKYTFQGNICLSLENCQDSESIQIIVSDTGIGMRESTVKKLNLFSESIQSEFDYQSGLGLGLQLINNLIQKIGPTQSLKVKKNSQDGGTIVKFSVYKDIVKKQSLYSAQMISFDSKQSPKCNKETLQISYNIQNEAEEFKSTEQKENVRSHIKREMKKSFSQLSILSLAKSQQCSIAEDKNQINYMNILQEQLCNKKIMIVDDTVFNILAMKILFKNISNLVINEAYNGEQAVNLFKSAIQQEEFKQSTNLFIPDIIFMDINMPIKDGIQATKEINELALVHKIQVKIITVSAFDQESDRENFLIAGSHYHIAKPIKIESLVEGLHYIGY